MKKVHEAKKPILMMKELSTFPTKPEFKYLILDENNEVLSVTLEEYTERIKAVGGEERLRRKVADSFFTDGSNLSTVLLPMDISFGESRGPFETMFFTGPSTGEADEDYTSRHHTYTTALDYHLATERKLLAEGRELTSVVAGEFMKELPKV